MAAADEAMLRGVPVLEKVLAPYGFAWTPGRKGTGSGGYSVSGAFVCGDRELEIHYRYNLGMVTYRVGSTSIDHESYMRAVVPKGKASSYPGFSKEGSIDAFRHLADDIEHFCQAFLKGEVDKFTDIAKKAAVKDARRRLP